MSREIEESLTQDSIEEHRNDIIKHKIREVLDELNIAYPSDRILENIDSLELVDLVIALESAFSLKASIVSNNTFSRTHSPFVDVDSLANYIRGIINA